MNEYTNEQWAEAEAWAANELEARGIDATANPDILNAMSLLYVTEKEWERDD